MKGAATPIIEAPAPATEAAPLKVLLIEDNPLDARLIGIMLRDAASGLFELEQVDRLAAGLKRAAGCTLRPMVRLNSISLRAALS